MKIIYYLDDAGGYIGVSDEAAMDGTVFAGRGPVAHSGPEGVQEQAYFIGQLRKWKAVRPEDVPDDWMLAIGYEKPRPPQPVPAEPVRIVEQPVLVEHIPQTTWIEVEMPWDRWPAKPVSPAQQASSNVWELVILVTAIIAMFVSLSLAQ